MESADRERIELAAQNNQSIKRLYDEHKFLDDKISNLETRRFLSPKEENELKTLKKKKLRGKEQLLELIEEHRHPEQRLN